MPKISKVRIVNFNYNDGNRLIADELFDFTNRKDDDALNVLINLANGGGKSVLVQLMMQPIIPKAKVAGRKVESFFNKLTDHCFVILEWFKDDSSEKLLTGIAMAAREVASTEDETSGGMGIKYYTFISNYPSDSSDYSLVNLPLSRKENGRFVPAEYDCIKKLSRKSRNSLMYYSSDDNPQWQRKLEEYGLVQDEWRMMEKLNSEEGGLGKFFGEFKTSDQLIDRLLIPTIEGKLKSGHGKEDSSLTTMLISYAGQYAGQKDKLLKKEGYEKFLRGLDVLKPLTEDLWNKCNERQDAVGVLFSLSAALRQKAETLRKEQATIQRTVEDIHESIHHVAWEQVSERYYRCQEAFEQAEQVWQDITLKKQHLQESFDQTVLELAAQECANYYDQLCKCESSILELQNEISQRESNADSSNEIAVLGYSASCAIQEAIQENQPKLDAYKEQHKELKDQICERKTQTENTQKALNIAQSEYDRLHGQLDAAEKETDKEVGNLNSNISRRLDQSYAEEEFESMERTLQTEQDDILTAKEEAESEAQKIEARLDQIPQECADCREKIKEYQRQQDKEQENLKNYETQEDQVQSICTEYNLDFAQRFTSMVMDYLSSEKQTSEAKYAECLRQLSLSEEEIKAAKSGYLHVPQGVIDYLNSTGVVYTTCEKYLLDLVESQKLSHDRCLQILQRYPAAAYGILMTEENNKKFFNYGREKWLPAMIPLFTYEQMDIILLNEKQHSGAIAFYSEAYFADRTNFISHLLEQRQQLLDKKTLEENKIKHLQEQMLTMSAFTYTEGWVEQQHQKLAAISANIQKEKQKYEKLECERESLRQKKQQLSLRLKEYQAKVQSVQNKLSCLVRIHERIKTELELNAKVTAQKSKRNELKQQLTEEKQNLDALYQQLEVVKIQLNDLERLIDELNTALPEVRGKNATERISGRWQDLLERYRQRIQTEHAEIAQLQHTLQEKRDQSTQFQKEIQKRALPKDAYENLLYSSEQEQILSRKRKELDLSLKAQYQQAERAADDKGKAEGLLQSAQSDLSKFGEPLEKSQIGSDFERRLNDYQAQQDQQRTQAKQCAVLERKIEKEQGKLENYLSDISVPKHIPETTLEDDYSSQCSAAMAFHKQCKQMLEKAEHKMTEQLDLLRRDFMEGFPEIQNAIDSMRALLQNSLRGDRYFTLDSLVDEYHKNTNLAISQLNTDLNEFENFRRDLVYQCTLQGKQIFEGLKQMESSSRVAVYDGMPKKCMIQFGFPDHVDAAVAEASIGDEIDKGTKEIAEQLSDETITEAEIKKYAEKIVGSRNLLRKYLGRDLIQVSAYKIDQNPYNSGYRKWKETQINNSGAEKFVVYFAVILSLINYTRGSLGGIQDKERRSVLILDNPFGATSSKHILVPMFAIAKHFRVQMICLSDINKTDVINCFDIVIKALVKKRPMSHHELLTHEGNELIDHGYYRAEQMSLL